MHMYVRASKVADENHKKVQSKVNDKVVIWMICTYIQKTNLLHHLTKHQCENIFALKKNGKSLLTSHQFREKVELPCAVGPI